MLGFSSESQAIDDMKSNDQHHARPGCVGRKTLKVRRTLWELAVGCWCQGSGLVLGSGVGGLGFGGLGLRFGVKDFAFGVSRLAFRVSGFGFRFWFVGCGIWGLEFKA